MPHASRMRAARPNYFRPVRQSAKVNFAAAPPLSLGAPMIACCCAPAPRADFWAGWSRCRPPPGRRILTTAKRSPKHRGSVLRKNAWRGEKWPAWSGTSSPIFRSNSRCTGASFRAKLQHRSERAGLRSQSLATKRYRASCAKSWRMDWDGSDRLSHFRAHLRAQNVDQSESPRRFHVPIGPGVAGFQALRQRADAVNRTDRFAECQRAVGANQGAMAPLGVDEARAGGYQTALDKRGERHARRFARGHERGQRRLRQRLDRFNALARRSGIVGIPLDADETAAQAVGDRAGCAAAAKWIEHQIVRARGGKHDARQERFRFLRRMQLLAIAAFESLVAGAQRNEPIRAHLNVIVAGLERLVIERVIAVC